MEPAMKDSGGEMFEALLSSIIADAARHGCAFLVHCCSVFASSDQKMRRRERQLAESFPVQICAYFIRGVQRLRPTGQGTRSRSADNEA